MAPAVPLHPPFTRFGPARPWLVAYFPVNDPSVPIDLLEVYDTAGVDIVELGLKAARPTHDGAVVGASMKRSTGAGLVGDALDAARRVQGFRNPARAILFGYAEAPLQAADADWAGIDGLLCLGSDPAARARVLARARSHGTRIAEYLPYEFDQGDIARALGADAYVMLHYSPGLTGLRGALDPMLGARLARLRTAGVSKPIVTGVGISTFEQARHAVQNGAEGVVLGSMTLVKAQESRQSLQDYLGRMREVLDLG